MRELSACLKSIALLTCVLGAACSKQSNSNPVDAGNEVQVKPGTAGTGKLAYQKEVNGKLEMEVLSLETAKVIFRSETEGALGRPYLSRDGNRLAWLAAGNNRKVCRMVALPQTAAEPCGPEVGTILQMEVFGVSKDGNRVALAYADLGVQPVSTRVGVWENGAFVQWTSFLFSEYSLTNSGAGALNLEGTRMALIVNRKVGSDLRPVLMSVTPAGHQELFAFSADYGNLDLSPMNFSDDGSKLVFTTTYSPSGAHTMADLAAVVVDATTGQPRPFPGMVRSAISPDGAWIYGASGDFIARAPSGDPAAKQNLELQGDAPTFSPDGARIAYRDGSSGHHYDPATATAAGKDRVVVADNGGSAPGRYELSWSR